VLGDALDVGNQETEVTEFARRMPPALGDSA
jgi:hypothetical protein